jgi:fatty acid desaturase
VVDELQGRVPAEFSPEVRQYVAAAQAEPARFPAARVAAILAMTGALGSIIAFSGLVWLCVLASFCLGLLLCTLDVMQHEATHRQLARSRTLNRVAGVLVTAVLARNFSQYCAFHFAHHAHTCTEEDPEGDHVVRSKAQLLSIPIRTVGFWFRQWRDLAVVIVGGDVAYVRTRKQTLDIRIDSAAAAVIYGLFAVAASAYPVLLICWLGPLAVYILAGFPLQHLHEHYGIPVEYSGGPRSRPQSAVTRSLRVTSAVSWLLGYSNLHKVHHMFPSVPSHALPRLHRVVLEHDPWVDLNEPGIAAFVTQSWRNLPLTTPQMAGA